MIQAGIPSDLATAYTELLEPTRIRTRRGAGGGLGRIRVAAQDSSTSDFHFRSLKTRKGLVVSRFVVDAVNSTRCALVVERACLIRRPVSHKAYGVVAFFFDAFAKVSAHAAAGERMLGRGNHLLSYAQCNE